MNLVIFYKAFGSRPFYYKKYLRNSIFVFTKLDWSKRVPDLLFWNQEARKYVSLALQKAV